MKTLIRTRTDILWMPNPHEARLYLTDEAPPPSRCGSAFGFAGESDQTVYRWIERGLVQVIARRLTSKRYLIPASEVERVKRARNYGDLEGKAMPALINA